VVGLLVSEFLGLEKAFKVGRPVNFVRASRRIEGFLGPSPRYANYTEFPRCPLHGNSTCFWTERRKTPLLQLPSDAALEDVQASPASNALERGWREL